MPRKMKPSMLDVYIRWRKSCGEVGEFQDAKALNSHPY
ncbi:MAG: hypothetical protein Hyperionvirus45_5 [Hyperionvirus sp.]|uniref:Uncharacterized protein n=1 Tax=Hyperionvirus sp. TaxID=2487770 RepID=A0A3G5ACB8_9VIRU|nr:MAG: hypothetical protein Hyperionvirus45_5 [Hyperionvirus sp.]